MSQEAVSVPSNSNPNSNSVKRKRSLPGNPDPDSEVIALSPKSLMTTNRFICEVCNKGFKRDQNLQLHRRGHNLPWKLKQRNPLEVIRRKVYVCPEKSCVHHEPSRALGDLTGIKKHFSRKHGEKKWKCDKCSKKYAVQSDWKAHSKICGTREYRCDCGTLFSRKDSFLTHRAFCESLVERNARIGSIPSNFGNNLMINTQLQRIPHQGLFGLNQEFGGPGPETFMATNFPNNNNIPHNLLFSSSASGTNSDLELVLTNNMNTTFGSLLPQGQWNMNYRYNEHQTAEASFISSGGLSMPMSMNMMHAPQGVLLKLEQQQEEDKIMHADLSHLYTHNQLQEGPSHHVSTMESTTTNVMINGNNNNNNNNVAAFNNSNNIVEMKNLFNQGNVLHDGDKHELSLTRDFLGVESLKLQQQEVPRFNPIGSVMHMQNDQFGGHY
ncbi:unnamed protein product [Trifolium pratense]|uniref:Uncharacterized protein n=1 Tax=Trifolium pratense TaxID=57577 RepID=A0ACB0KW04_TRIPR|nr:unnamed protein product [Trifolium pratense]